MDKQIMAVILPVLILAFAEVGYAQEMNVTSGHYQELRARNYAGLLKFDEAAILKLNSTDVETDFEAAYAESEQDTAGEDKKLGLYGFLGFYQGCTFPLITYAIVYNVKELHSDKQFREKKEGAWERKIIGSSLVMGYAGGLLCSRADKPYHWSYLTHGALLTTLIVLLSVYVE